MLLKHIVDPDDDQLTASDLKFLEKLRKLRREEEHPKQKKVEGDDKEEKDGSD